MSGTSGIGRLDLVDFAMSVVDHELPSTWPRFGPSMYGEGRLQATLAL